MAVWYTGAVRNTRLLLEEIFNSITHGLGVLLVVAGVVTFFLLRTAASDELKIIGFSIFAGSLFLMYLISTLTHSLIFTKAKKVFMILDHSAIYLLIAGTYTPFLLTSLKGLLGYVLLGVVWTLALSGIVFKAFFVEKFKTISTILYIGLGWLIVIAVKPLLQAVTLRIFLFMLLGGIFYTLGTIFYSAKKLPFAHTIWHLFVLVGSACHFAAIYLL